MMLEFMPHPEKLPPMIRPILPGLFAFRPNRATLGGTAYFIQAEGEQPSLLIDSPAYSQENLDFLEAQGGVDLIFITHRGAIGETKKFQQHFGCTVVLQEQEAYLVDVPRLKTFEKTWSSGSFEALWTPGHSPGSSCLLWKAQGGIVFSGRHLLPDARGYPVPLKTQKTFHWPRQIKQVQALLEEWPDFQYLCPGAGTGFLRGKGIVEEAHRKVSAGLGGDMAGFLQ
jgi:glyoxylase-like metal-dependent hydrolase (beta-lactamase superfamily II)